MIFFQYPTDDVKKQFFLQKAGNLPGQSLTSSKIVMVLWGLVLGLGLFCLGLFVFGFFFFFLSHELLLILVVNYRLSMKTSCYLISGV